MEFLIPALVLYLFVDSFRSKRRSQRQREELAAAIPPLERALEKLMSRIAQLEAAQGTAPVAQPAAPPQQETVVAPLAGIEPAAPTPPPAEPAQNEPSIAPADSTWLTPLPIEPVSVTPELPAAFPQADREPEAPAAPPAWLLAARKWLFTGNLVAKFGLLILFIGVSFLLKYAAERITIPIELRYAGVVLADIGLLVWGWRIRTARRGIGLPVQGAALGILMLTTFGAYSLSHLIPSGLAFGVLFALTVFTCLLAVLQDAMWLAVFGIAGGFAAPVLTSTGHGSHIALFSYYAVLNTGILAIVLKKSWRLLNLLGFAFTFLIGTAWGELKYQPENYLSAQVFLCLFFLFYVGIAVAYANRQAPRLKHYVDATLVFGTPILGFALQFGLVRDKQFGLALSALALGIFYIGLAMLLWRRRGSNLRMLIDAFLAMGVVFGTLALPFALDQRWTSGAWALEGAAMVWIGLRQKSVLTWSFGLLVQAGAWVSFIAALSGLDPAQAAKGNIWLGFLLLTGSAFAMAINFRANAGNGAPGKNFAVTGNLFLGIAAVWLLGGAWAEVFVRFDALGSHPANLLVFGAMATATVLYLIAASMQWLVARAFALVAQLAGGTSLLFMVVSQLDLDGGRYHVFAGAAMIMAGALFSSRRLYLMEGENYRLMSNLLLAWAAWWCFGPMLSIIAGYATDLAWLPSRLDNYQIAVAVTSILLSLAARRLAWPQMRWLGAMCWLTLLVTTVTMLRWMEQYYLPSASGWAAWLSLWLGSEYLLHLWKASGWTIPDRAMMLLHVVRIAGPWAMIWPVGAVKVSNWLHGLDHDQATLLASAGWQVSGGWADYLPAWVMMAVLSWLTARSRRDVWPVQPLARWYRTILLPLGTVWALLLVSAWNLLQNGAMAPLPYLPLLNPLDLTTGFVAIQAILCYRMARADVAGSPAALQRVLDGLPLAAGFAAYGWFNLMLLRTAARYLGIDYRFDVLASSQFVQALLSLTWCITSLILMRRAHAAAPRPRLWILGAVLLGVVVAKLFIADLANVGSMARIVSFVGVGALMVAIGYLAPYPSRPSAPEPEPEPKPVAA
jgi:uncharacterized membrane protein